MSPRADAPSLDTLVSSAPYDGAELGTVPVSPPDQVAAAASAAAHGQVPWEARGPVQRALALGRAAAVVSARRDELARLLAAEVGKPVVEAMGEVDRTALILSYYGGIGQDLGGQLRRSGDPQVSILARRVPVGVAGVVTPWNFPLAIPAWKIAPALAAGCAVVWKPSEHAPLTAAALCQVLIEADVPADAVLLVQGGAATGRALLEQPLAAFSFTGSTGVGRTISRTLAGRFPAPRLTVELGGVNLGHVLADADIAVAARDLLASSFGYAGQKCTATRVVAVHRTRYDELVDALRDGLADLAVGDPLDDSTRVGPVIDEPAAAAIRAQVEALRADRPVLAERVVDGPVTLVSPTVLAVEGDSDLLRHELFGPVLGVLATDSDEDHRRAAAVSGLGLAASIHTTDFDRARELMNAVGTGVVSVNRPSTGLDPHVPFGGWSGSGGAWAEQGHAALDFYLRWQTAYWRSATPEGNYP